MTPVLAYGEFRTIGESFQLQMGFSFPFLRANNLRTSLLNMRTRSLLYVGLFLNLIANAVNNNANTYDLVHIYACHRTLT